MTQGEKVELHELSLTIGELRADVKSNRVAMDRIEKRINDLTEKLSDLPPSPHCVAKHEKLENELRDLRVDNAKHATIISAFVAGIILFGKQLLMMLGGPLPK